MRAQTAAPPPVAPRPTARPTQAVYTGTAGEAVAYVRRAEQALAHKDIDGAVRMAKRAREHDPNVPMVNAFYAWVRVLSGELRARDAIPELDKILAHDETCTPARLYRAKLLKRDDRLPEAMRELENVLASDPDNRDAQNELKLMMLTIKPGR